MAHFFTIFGGESFMFKKNHKFAKNRGAAEVGL